MSQTNPYEATVELEKPSLEAQKQRFPLIRLAVSTLCILIGALLLASWLLFIVVSIMQTFFTMHSDEELPITGMKTNPTIGLVVYTLAFAVPGYLWFQGTRCFWNERYLKGMKWIATAILLMMLGRLLVEWIVLKD